MTQYRSFSLTWSATFFKEKKFFTWEEKSPIQVPEAFWVHQHGRCFIVFSGKLVGSLSNDNSDGNEDGKKARGLDWQNNNFVRGSRWFVHFFAVVARLRRETEDVNTRQRPSFSQCSNLTVVHSSKTSKKIWQRIVFFPTSPLDEKRYHSLRNTWNFFCIIPKSGKSLETNEELPKANVSITNRQKSARHSLAE